MGWENRVSLREQMIEGVSERINELIELLGFDNMQAFANKCLIEPNSIHRLARKKKAVPSFEFLARMLVVFPQVNVNWIISGEGPPLIDWHLLDVVIGRNEAIEETKRLREEINNLAYNLLMIRENLDYKLENPPSEWSRQKAKVLKAMRKPMEDQSYKGLGRMQLAVLQYCEKGWDVKKIGSKYFLEKGGKTKQMINYTIPVSLEERGFLKKIEPNKWIYDAKKIQQDGRAEKKR